MYVGRKYYISTKIDGTSITMYRKNGVFGVCSHENEIIFDEEIPSAIWDFAKKIDLEKKMIEANLDNIAIQGELAGGGIQKNRLKLLN